MYHTYMPYVCPYVGLEWTRLVGEGMRRIVSVTVHWYVKITHCDIKEEFKKSS